MSDREHQLLETRLRKIERDWTGCQDCRLGRKRTNHVFGRIVGSLRTSGLLIFGEAPGKEEDETGLAFVGKAGKKLDQLLERAEIFNAFIANPVCCRPPFNRRPWEDELQACLGRIQRVYLDLKPAVVFTLGKTAANWILESEYASIDILAPLTGEVFGFEWAGQEALAVATWHPSYLLQRKGKELEALEHFRLVRSLLQEVQHA